MTGVTCYSFLQLFLYASEGDVKRLRELIMIETAKNEERERRKKQASKGGVDFGYM